MAQINYRLQFRDISCQTIHYFSSEPNVDLKFQKSVKEFSTAVAFSRITKLQMFRAQWIELFYPLSPINCSYIRVLPQRLRWYDFTMSPLFFTSPLRGIHPEACYDRYCVWERESEREHIAGGPNRIGALKSLVMSRFEPRPPAWQGSALSIVLYPLGSEYKTCFPPSSTRFSSWYSTEIFIVVLSS